ncbi:MAG TPA: 3-deoxy-manno-octulosonate-8-phosphatase KdsC [Sedimenticola thiotaurini]|uniref:3-deoxy-D-manno-octulosonate 8-phosphate phosphatase KdsC n=1 Tax=Sedimenticola thiotaurini TaxID=1543721 RepID=A0A831RMT5_9GAMM|nr:3-deoxy-manno-octulosonate-8-phosphatase KdsC [Sedimenticola thiotaurini]
MGRDELQRRAARIRLVVFDVDGVLTDGSLYLGDDGQEYKAFNSKDGLGMKLLQSTGVEIGVITARTSQVVALRMESLGIRHLYQGRQDKLPAFLELLDRLGLEPEQAAYVGDDLLDLPIMARVGLAVTVQDAHHEVVRRAHWQTRASGGRGAAREVCELLMQAQGSWQGVLERFT